MHVALLGAVGDQAGVSKSYWALALSPNSDGDESMGGGIDVDSSDNVYWAFYDNSGSEAYLIKFEQSGDLPTADVQTKLDNYVPISGLTVWDDSGTETLACYGTRNEVSESCWIYSIETDLTTGVGGSSSRGIYINSGDNMGKGANQAELDTTNGKFFWSSIEAFNYFGWRTIQGGVWFYPAYLWGQTTYPTYTGGSGLSSDNATHDGNCAFQWGANRWGVTCRRGSQPIIAGNHTTSGQTVVGTAYEYWGSDGVYIQNVSSSATWNTGETGDEYAYWLTCNPYIGHEKVSLIKLNDAGTVQWNRSLSGDSMYGPGTTGAASSAGGQPCKPIFDSSDNCYIAWGDSLGSGGTERVSIVKYDSSGAIQWQNAIEATTVVSVANQFSPQQLALSADEEDLYVSINRCKLSGADGQGMILKVPSDGSLTSASPISIHGGEITYDSSSYTDAAGGWSVATGTTMGWTTSTSQSAAGSGTWGVGSTFTPHLYTAAVE